MREKLLRFLLVLMIPPFAAVGCGGKDTLEPADYHMIAAKQAIAADDTQRAIEELTAALAERDDAAAYRMRADIYIEQGQDDKAIADCESGLKINPEDRDLQWMLRELKKPSKRRFQGKNQVPPSASK